MPLVHGRDITAEEVESIVWGEFSVQRFAGLCNAIIWATDRPSLAQAAFTERVFVKDNGIDAEWILNAPPIAPGQLVESGKVVYQYKKRDISSRDRNSIVGKLVKELD